MPEVAQVILKMMFDPQTSSAKKNISVTPGYLTLYIQ